MADPIAPAAATAGAVLSMPFLVAIGIEPASMVSGLVGVVIVQTLLPRTQSGFFAIAGVATGSMFLASYAAPFIAPVLMSIGWEWMRSISPEHIKAASAAAVGGFAQPLLLWGSSLIPKPKGAVQ